MDYYEGLALPLYLWVAVALYPFLFVWLQVIYRQDVKRWVFRLDMNKGAFHITFPYIQVSPLQTSLYLPSKMDTYHGS